MAAELSDFVKDQGAKFGGVATTIGAEALLQTLLAKLFAVLIATSPGNTNTESAS